LRKKRKRRKKRFYGLHAEQLVFFSLQNKTILEQHQQGRKISKSSGAR
jgi:hypothetical protein